MMLITVSRPTAHATRRMWLRKMSIFHLEIRSNARIVSMLEGIHPEYVQDSLGPARIPRTFVYNLGANATIDSEPLGLGLASKPRNNHSTDFTNA